MKISYVFLLIILSFGCLLHCEDDPILEPSQEEDDNGSYGRLVLPPASDIQTDGFQIADSTADSQSETSHTKRSQHNVANPKVF